MWMPVPPPLQRPLWLTPTCSLPYPLFMDSSGRDAASTARARTHTHALVWPWVGLLWAWALVQVVAAVGGWLNHRGICSSSCWTSSARLPKRLGGAPGQRAAAGTVRVSSTSVRVHSSQVTSCRVPTELGSSLCMTLPVVLCLAMSSSAAARWGCSRRRAASALQRQLPPKLATTLSRGPPGHSVYSKLALPLSFFFMVMGLE